MPSDTKYDTAEGSWRPRERVEAMVGYSVGDAAIAVRRQEQFGDGPFN